MRLVFKATNKEVRRGDVIADFRGDEWRFLSLTRSGTRVYAERGGVEREFFKSVFPGVEAQDGEDDGEAVLA